MIAPPSSSDGTGAVSFAGVEAPAPPGAAPGGGAGGGGSGSGGSARATPAPEPSLGLASQVKLERLIAGIFQTFEGCCVLVIANAGNPAVVASTLDYPQPWHWFTALDCT